MKYKLFKIRISTYYFGNISDYNIYVLANDSDEALDYVYKNPKFKNDEDAEIDEVLEIAFETKGII